VDPTQVARRARESPYPLIDVTTAQKIVLEHAEVLGTKMVAFTEALGRVLAEDVFALDPLPPFPASIKDGYAVLASDGAGIREVLGTSVAGVSVSKCTVIPVFNLASHHEDIWEWRYISMSS
jgi:gephyrin